MSNNFGEIVIKQPRIGLMCCDRLIKLPGLIPPCSFWRDRYGKELTARGIHDRSPRKTARW